MPGIKISEHLPQARQADESPGHRPLDDHQGRRSRPGGVTICGPAICRWVRCNIRRSARSCRRNSAETTLPCRTSSASPRRRSSAPAAYGPGFLGPEYAPLMVGNTGYGFRPGANTYSDSTLKVQDLLPPKEIDEKQVDARLDLVKELQSGLRSPIDPASPRASQQAAYDRAVRLMRTAAGKAFNLDEENGRLARRLRPEPVRPGLPAGPPARRARRAVRRGHAVQRHRRPASAGTRTSDNFDQVKALSEAARPGLVHADDRPEGSRPARQHADRLDGRVRPHAEDQPPAAAATTSPTPGRRCWPAAASRAGRSSARPAPTA